MSTQHRIGIAVTLGAVVVVVVALVRSSGSEKQESASAQPQVPPDQNLVRATPPKLSPAPRAERVRPAANDAYHAHLERKQKRSKRLWRHRMIFAGVERDVFGGTAARLEQLVERMREYGMSAADIQLARDIYEEDQAGDPSELSHDERETRCWQRLQELNERLPGFRNLVREIGKVYSCVDGPRERRFFVLRRAGRCYALADRDKNACLESLEPNEREWIKSLYAAKEG